METVTQPGLFAPQNYPIIIVALIIAVGFIILNSYLTKTAKH